MGRGPIFTGGTVPQASHTVPADIYVNDIKIGTVNPKEAMVFDVAPGRYSFSWMIYNQKPGWGQQMRPSVADVPGGVIVGISAEYAGTTCFMSEGVMTSLLDKNGQKRLSPDIKVVRHRGLDGTMTALPAVGFGRTSLGVTAASAHDRDPLLEPQKSQ